LSLVKKYRICTSFEPSKRAEFKNLLFEVIRGHLRGQKGHFWVKIDNMSKFTWYTYESIQTFILILLMCILKSSEVMFGVKKGHSEVKNLNYRQIHTIYIWIDCKFCFESNNVPLKVNRGHLRGRRGSLFWNTAKYTWYVYDSFPNSIPILMAWISRPSLGSRKIILRSKKDKNGHWKVKLGKKVT